MADPVVSYPFDPTGQAQSNRITGEQIVIVAPGDRLFHYTMPRWAPMFEAGHALKLRDLNNSIIPLKMGVDYYLSHKFADASLATMHDIYGSISFLRRDIVGTLIADYNTLGGTWTLNPTQIVEILANRVFNPRIRTWEQVTFRPVDFPVIDHPWNLDDMVGMKEIIEMMERFYVTYLGSLDPSTGGGLISAHLADFANPHRTSANQTGAYSYAQIDNMLTGYLTTNGVAFNSNRLGGKTLAEIFLDAVNIKVRNAFQADTATNATRAVTSSDSEKLAGQTLQQIINSLQASTSDARTFNGKGYEEVRADFMAGTADNANKLGGQTLQQIKTELQAATGDAVTLQGRSYDQIMQQVVSTKVNNAIRADVATNADKLGGKTASQIIAEAVAVVPELARNSERVYGFDFDELVDNIVDSDTYFNKLTYTTLQVNPNAVTVNHANDGGNLDPNYLYTIVGEFIIPGTDVPPWWDKSQSITSSVLDVYLYWKGHTNRVRLDVTAFEHPAGNSFLKYYSDLLVTGQVQFGLRKLISPYRATDGTQAYFNQVWMKFNKNLDLKHYSIFQFNRNSFILRDPLVKGFWDHTSIGVSSVVWQPQENPGSVTDLADDTQAAFDAMGDHITVLIATPAA